MPNIRFTIIDNGNQIRKMILVGVLPSGISPEQYLTTLIKLSSQKMRYKVKGIFNARGEKITTENIDQLKKYEVKSNYNSICNLINVKVLYNLLDLS